MEEKYEWEEVPQGESISADFEHKVSPEVDSVDMGFVNLVVRIIVNATIKECDEEGNQVSTV